MEKKVAVILINYKDYAKKYLGDCLASLRAQDYQGGYKIFLVDNETSEESFNYLKEQAPEAEIIRNKNNDGFAKGNNDAMKQAITENFSYIFLLNMDTVMEPQALSFLVKAMGEEEKAGAIQARLMLHPEKEKINSLGNAAHFLGFGYCLNYREEYQVLKHGSDRKKIFYPSGAAVLLRSSALEKIGLFDEKYFMYNEDEDLGWRLWLSGFECLLEPQAVVYHKYEFSKSISKYYYMDRNRLITIFKNYECLTLILIFPALVIMELGLMLFALKGGWFKDRFRVWGFFLNPFNWGYLWTFRRKSRRLALRKDKEIVKFISGKIWYQEIDDPKLRFINPIFNAYWFLVKKIICLFR